MDYNMKQWRYQQQQQQQQGDDESAAAATPAKIPRLFFDSQIIKEQEEEEDDDEKNKNAGKTECSVSPQLHLFVPTDDDKLANNSLSAYPYYHSTSRLPKMGEGGSYFSYGQWQELELQALIYRHMLAGAAIPPQLLLMLHKSLFDTTPPPATTNHLSSSYYLPPLQHYSHYHPALLQSGYWGKGAMDPEPGRCRRTDGKKWRCSRDVVGGQKYCERHVHRGRNRSRKPVEHPATTTPLSTLGGGNSVACSNSNTTGLASSQVTRGVSVHFDLTGPSAYMDQFQHAQRPSGPQTENKITSEFEEVNGNLKPSGQALRHFFDDWSNRSSDSSGSSASLSISTSTSGNMPSDFSLKLTTGNGNESGDGERTRSGWGGAGWGSTNQVAPMGGPLAEALRSSRGSNTSPTCVLNLVK